MAQKEFRVIFDDVHESRKISPHAAEKSLENFSKGFIYDRGERARVSLLARAHFLLLYFYKSLFRDHSLAWNASWIYWIGATTCWSDD